MVGLFLLEIPSLRSGFRQKAPASAENLILQHHLEKINLDLRQLRQSCPKHRLLKGLNQNGLSEIVQLNIKSLSEAGTNSFCHKPLPHMCMKANAPTFTR